MPILKLSRVLVSLPLLAVPLGMMAVSPAKASGTAAEEAVQILTRARSADSRCNYLSATERRELSRYTARAEIAAASQASPGAAKSAAAAGVAEGRSAGCSSDVEADVRETLEAARAAVAAANTEESEPRDTVAPRRETRVATALTDDEDEDDAPRAASTSLGQYDRVVRAYYLERECRSLSRRDADRFWNGVVRLHRSAVRANGKSAVARVMASAEQKAMGSSCGRNAEARIRQGYELVLSR